MSEARTEDRLGRLETDVAEIKTTLARLEPMIIRIDAQLPYLATKAELITGLSEVRGEVANVKIALADKPNRGFIWGVMTAMVGAQAVALAAATLIIAVLQTRPAPPAAVPHASAAGFVLAGETRPYSCRLYDDEHRKCAFGSCDQRALDRLENECLRDGGRP